jgi:hypothetical protein
VAIHFLLDFKTTSSTVETIRGAVNPRQNTRTQKKYTYMSRMKKSVVLSLTILATSSAVQSVEAQATILANWTFETSGLGSSSPTFAPGAGIASTNFYAESGAQAGTAAAFGFHTTASTYSSPAGNGSTKSLSANNWSVGDYYEFSVSTVGFDNITISYDQNGSATGPSTFQLAYSINGTTFNNFGSTYVIPSGVTWNGGTANALGNTSFSFDLSGISAIDNLSTLTFRIIDSSTTAINGTTVGTGGTDRIDNFTVTSVPEPSSIALAAIGGVACFFAIRRKK